MSFSAGVIVLSIFYSFFLNCVFRYKARIDTPEEKTFYNLVTINFFGLVLESSLIFLITKYGTESIISLSVYKLYLAYLAVFCIMFFDYNMTISMTEEYYKKHSKLIHTFIYLLMFLTLLLALTLPSTLKMSDAGIFSEGPACDALYLISAGAILLCVLSALRAIITKKAKARNFIPLFVMLGGFIVALVIQSIDHRWTLMTVTETFGLLAMFFTIENPDIKIIDQLNIAKNEAEKANKAKSDFLSSMSHEIRTPLNAIVGFNECITEAKTLEEAKENAKDVITAANTLLETINGILDISKIESGKLEVINVRYKPKKLFEDSVKLLESRIMDKNLEFNVKIAEDLPYKLMGDQANLKKCVINLLTNAVKYTDSGSITFHVNCVNEDNNCKLIISVEDTGRGIKPENIEKLFTKFQRLEEDKNSTIEGTGLGLAITKQLIELMGGKIVVQSLYGSGSKFTIYISQEIIQMAPSVEKEIFNEVEPNALTFNNNKIVLIVDDNMLNLKVASKLLEKYDLNIDTAESGSECIDKVKSIKYDLILMDDMMPKMTGTETLHILKQDSNFDIPVIALTANALVGEREKYLKEGFLEYLSKPIDRVELEKCLKHFLINNKKRPISFDDTEAYTLDFTKER